MVGINSSIRIYFVGQAPNWRSGRALITSAARSFIVIMRSVNAMMMNATGNSQLAILSCQSINQAPACHNCCILLGNRIPGNIRFRSSTSGINVATDRILVGSSNIINTCSAEPAAVNIKRIFIFEVTDIEITL